MSHSLVSDIGLAILSASLFGLLASFCRIPLISAFIAAGVLLGSSMGLGLITNTDNINSLSEIGFILLMFILGMEIDLKKLRQAGKVSFIVGMVQVIFSFVFIWGFLHFSNYKLGSGKYEQLYIATALSLSSTLVIIKTLSEKMILSHLTSRITIAIAIIQDIWAISFLSFQHNFGVFDPILILESFAKIFILILISWLFSRYILPRYFKLIEHHPEHIIISSVAWCFALTTLSNSLKLSKEMGALIAGVTVATLPYSAEITSKIVGLRDFFITLFFVALGLQLPALDKEMMIFTLVLTTLVFLTRFITITPILHFFSYGNRTSFIPALNLAQVSEFSLVLCALGLKYEHVDSTIFYGFTWAFVVTSIISSFSIPKGDSLFKALNPLLEKMGMKDNIDTQATELHEEKRYAITFIGFHRTTSSLVRELGKRFTKQHMDQIQIIDANPENVRKLRRLKFIANYADLSHPETFQYFSIQNSDLIICTVPDQFIRGTTNLKLLRYLRKTLPQARIIMTSETLAHATEMYSEGADYVFIPRFINATYLADFIERININDWETMKNKAREYLEDKKKEILP